jgi:cytochrome c oxidase subunit 2
VLHSFYVPDFRIKKDVVPNRYTSLWFQTNQLYVDKNVAMPNFGDYPDFKQIHDASSLDGKGIGDPLGYTGAEKTLSTVAEQCKKEKEKDASFKCESDPAKIPYGLHQVYCTEYCGDHHSRMLSKAVVLEPADFELWVKSKTSALPYDGATDAVARGEYVAKQCKGCHSIDGSKLVGPSWKGTYNTERLMADGSKVKMDDGYILESIRTPGVKIVDGYPNGMTPFPADVVSDDDVTYLIEYMKTLK